VRRRATNEIKLINRYIAGFGNSFEQGERIGALIHDRPDPELQQPLEDLAAIEFLGVLVWNAKARGNCSRQEQ